MQVKFHLQTFVSDNFLIAESDTNQGGHIVVTEV